MRRSTGDLEPIDADELMSMEAVAYLRGTGLTVRRLASGFPEWRAAGRLVASIAA